MVQLISLALTKKKQTNEFAESLKKSLNYHSQNPFGNNPRNIINSELSMLFFQLIPLSSSTLNNQYLQYPIQIVELLVEDVLIC